ncbi:hypothetical protein HaLaN_24610, partial [Haematococcus lacustris]
TTRWPWLRPCSLPGHPTQLVVEAVAVAASERNWSAWGRLYTAARNRLGKKLHAKELIFIKANADCYGCNGGVDAELFALMGE